jgi:tetratricopeptide (TPR) repeat protein
MQTRFVCAVACAVLGAALTIGTPALAQSGRAQGVVRDLSGKPIKGASVRAVNPEAYPPELTSATDDKGRFGMIGLRSGNWRFVIDAPGFLRLDVTAPVRQGVQVPMQFAMAKDPGPQAAALDRNIQQRIQEATTLRDAGQFDQALAAYQDIYARNPMLTSLNLVVGDVYRRKAAQTSDTTAKAALLERAVQAYNEVLKVDASNERALAEISALRAGSH